MKPATWPTAISSREDAIRAASVPDADRHGPASRHVAERAMRHGDDCRWQQVARGSSSPSPARRKLRHQPASGSCARRGNRARHVEVLQALRENDEVLTGAKIDPFAKAILCPANPIAHMQDLVDASPYPQEGFAEAQRAYDMCARRCADISKQPDVTLPALSRSDSSQPHATARHGICTSPTWRGRSRSEQPLAGLLEMLPSQRRV